MARRSDNMLRVLHIVVWIVTLQMATTATLKGEKRSNLFSFMVVTHAVM